LRILLGSLIGRVRPARGKLPRAYDWEVIHDPTPDRLFHGRVFRLMDLKHGAKWRNWPDGTTWRNRHTGQTARIENGRLVMEGSGDEG